MKPYEKDGVVNLLLYRQYKAMRAELIKTWKNPLLKCSDEQLRREKVETGRALMFRPESLELRVRWEILQEVEHV